MQVFCIVLKVILYGKLQKYSDSLSVMRNNSNLYKLSLEVGTLLLPARCNLQHYHSFFGAALCIGCCPNIGLWQQRMVSLLMNVR